MTLDRLKESGHGDHGLLIGVFEEAWGKWRTGLGPRILAKAGKLIRCGLDGAIANHRAADRLVGRLFVRPLTACAAPTTEPVSDWLHATRILSRRQPGLGDAPLAQLRAKAGMEPAVAVLALPLCGKGHTTKKFRR